VRVESSLLDRFRIADVSTARLPDVAINHKLVFLFLVLFILVRQVTSNIWQPCSGGLSDAFVTFAFFQWKKPAIISTDATNKYPF
jgi:hypothetical protein